LEGGRVGKPWSAEGETKRVILGTRYKSVLVFTFRKKGDGETKGYSVVVAMDGVEWGGT